MGGGQPLPQNTKENKETPVNAVTESSVTVFFIYRKTLCSFLQIMFFILQKMRKKRAILVLYVEKF